MKINGQSKYIYAIIESKKPCSFEVEAIGGRGERVHTVHVNGLAAVVSSSPIVRYPVTRDNSLAHQRVVEKVMGNFTVLPVRFCTIATSVEDIRKKVLKTRFEEFKSLLSQMEGKVELGVRAMWTNPEEIFEEILKENPAIARLKEEILQEPSEQKAYAGKIKIGELVKAELEEKKEREAAELLEVLESLAEDYRENRILGDRNILNAAFLVKKVKEKAFDRKIEELEKTHGPRKKFSYIGPVPPYNFVEVVINW